MAIHHRSHRFLLDAVSSSTASPRNANGTGTPYTGDANFDTNMVIILAALLCALVCALGLNSIVRCALRCSRRLAFETPDEAAARLASKGIKKRALRNIPIEVYGSSGTTSIPATECPICLGEFMDGEKVRVLPKCNHGFHVRCIDKWLMSHSNCPTCRTSLLEQQPNIPEAAIVAIAAAVAADAAGTRHHVENNVSAGHEHASVSVAVAVDEVA